MKCFRNSLLILSLFFSINGKAEDDRVQSAEGFKQIELVSELKAITPGEPFRVGMLFTLLPDYHTYWRGPGIVGVAPAFEWELPEGFSVGKTFWPAPEVVDMVGIKANGYHGELLLITEITPPATLDSVEAVLKVRAAWMACATSCHPGLSDFTMTLPVRSAREPSPMAARFAETLSAIPSAAPADWKWEVRREGAKLQLKLDLPKSAGHLKKGTVHFFCDDMQVDSDQAQLTVRPATGDYDVIQQLPVPDFAPKNPEKLSGLLYHSNGWPDVDSNYVEVSIPLPATPANHE